MYRKSRPGKIKFMGFTLVRLPDSCTRKARAFYREGNLIAVQQQNGNVALTHTGMFEEPVRPRDQLRAVQCLHGLGLVGEQILADYKKRSEDHEHYMDMCSLESEAERLGCTVKHPRNRTTK